MNILEVEEYDNKYVLSFEYDPAINKLIKNNLGARWSPPLNSWTCEMTDHNKFVTSLYSKGNPYFIYNLPLKVEELKEKWEITLLQTFGIVFWDYQWIMLCHLLTRRRCINAAKTRMGKSLPAMVAMWILKIQKPWIVSSLSGATGFKRELTKWGVIDFAYIMTYDAFTRIIGDAPESVPDCILYDEFHAMKSSSSNRGRAGREATKMQFEKYDDPIAWGLSATPSPKDVDDFWNPVSIMRPGFLEEKNQFTFKNRMAHIIMMDGPHGAYPTLDIKKGKNGWKEDELKKLGGRLKGMIEFFRPEDYGVEKVIPDDIIEMPIDRPTKAVIRMLKKLHAGSGMYQKYQQLDDGFMYDTDDEGKKTITKFYTPKDETFVRRLGELEEEGLYVIYAYYTESVNKLIDIAVGEGWAVMSFSGSGKKVYNTTRSFDECLEEFDASGGPRKVQKLVMINQSDSGAEGLELSRCNVMGYYSYGARPSSYWQSSGRMSSQLSKEAKMREHYRWLKIGQIKYENILAKEAIQSIPRRVLIDALEADLQTDRQEIEIEII